MKHSVVQVEERSKEPVLRKKLCPPVSQLEEFQDKNNGAETSQVNPEPLFITQVCLVSITVRFEEFTAPLAQ